MAYVPNLARKLCLRNLHQGETLFRASDADAPITSGTPFTGGGLFFETTPKLDILPPLCHDLSSSLPPDAASAAALPQTSNTYSMSRKRRRARCHSRKHKHASDNSERIIFSDYITGTFVPNKWHIALIRSAEFIYEVLIKVKHFFKKPTDQ
jgi:hypothetical protein